jgi:hypothetical protein
MTENSSCFYQRVRPIAVQGPEVKACPIFKTQKDFDPFSKLIPDPDRFSDATQNKTKKRK